MQTKTNRTVRTAHQLTFMAAFLYQHAALIESLSYDTMSEKLGTDWGDTPYVSFYVSGSYRLTFTVSGPDQRETMRLLRRAFGGQWEKEGHYGTFTLSRRITSESDDNVYIDVDIDGSREQVCQKVIVGTEVIEHPPVEAEPARTEEVEKVEWVCGNLLDD